MYPDDEDSVVSLHDFLGMTRKEYALFTEWNVLPNEPIEYDKFVEIRDSRLKVYKELARHQDLVKYLRENIALARTHMYSDELEPWTIEDYLNENEL